MLGILVVLLAFSVALIGCNREMDITGTWVGNIHGNNVTAELTNVGWTFRGPGFTDTGSFIRNGNDARLISDNAGRAVGSVSIIDKNTMSLTLNENSFVSGTFTLTR